VSRYQKGKTNLDFTEARDSDWQWHQLGRMQVCTSLQTDNHASIPPLIFLQAGCPSCRPIQQRQSTETNNQLINNNHHFMAIIQDNLHLMGPIYKMSHDNLTIILR